jgi:hypothetical protein
MFAMTYPAYVREKARELRVEGRLSIVEIAERLALPKTTIYYWLADVPLARSRRENPHPGTLAMQRKYQRLREAAYDEGRRTFSGLAEDPTFRDFVCMYVGEGNKRNRNAVAIGNSDPRVLVLATRWLRVLSRKALKFSIQYHADQDLRELREFWGRTLGIPPDSIAMQRKTNSGRLRGRNWRSRYGVLTVRVCDTQLRARLQAWMDCVQEQWLDSPDRGVAQFGRAPDLGSGGFAGSNPAAPTPDVRLTLAAEVEALAADDADREEKRVVRELMGELAADSSD